MHLKVNKHAIKGYHQCHNETKIIAWLFQKSNSVEDANSKVDEVVTDADVGLEKNISDWLSTAASSATALQKL